jgi:hypothetical protein
MITSEQIRAARALLRWEQKDLADASSISLPSIKRLESASGPLAAQTRTIVALRHALETAGVEFHRGERRWRWREAETVTTPTTHSNAQQGAKIRRWTMLKAGTALSGDADARASILCRRALP